MEIKITIDDTRAREFFTKFPGVLKQAVDKSLMQSALSVQNRAKSPLYAPYKTGNLRRSLGSGEAIQIRGFEAMIGTNLEYARKLEEAPPGKYTPRQGGQIPFLGPALTDSEKDISDIFEKNISEILP